MAEGHFPKGSLPRVPKKSPGTRGRRSAAHQDLLDLDAEVGEILALVGGEGGELLPAEQLVSFRPGDEGVAPEGGLLVGRRALLPLQIRT